jgi:DNA-binding GntR family transcriptional regulator
LREAFTILTADSIVKRIPNRGVFVAAPGIEEVREIYNLRCMIEPGAALWGHPTAAILDSMTEAIRVSHRAHEAEDIMAMANANQTFHKAVVLLAGSATLEQLIERVLA